MTNTEKQADWIKLQRKKIVDAINEVVEIVIMQNLSSVDRKPYILDFCIGMAGNNVTLRVYENSETKLIEKSEYWGLENIFSIDYKDSIQKNVKEFLAMAKEMKIIALKYSKLNDKD